MPGLDYTLDFDRLRRTGFPEIVLAEGKTPEQVVEICRQLARAHDVLVTRPLFSMSWRVITVVATPRSFSSSGEAVAVTTTFSEAGGI